ncbi:MAG: PepSY-associated TM helix domain-containing protein [Novosphingobium sp.]
MFQELQVITRANFLVLHRRLALVFAPLLFLQALTGGALLFKQPLGRLLDPSGTTRQSAHGAAPLSALCANAARPFRGYRVTRIYYPETASDVVFAQLSSAAGTMRYASLDPGSAAVLAAGPIWRFPIEAALQLHYRLLNGRTGLAIVLANALALALLASTGLGNWWPGRGRLAKSLAIRSAAPGRIRLRQWHRSIGVALSLVLLFSAITGVLLNIPDLIARAPPTANVPPSARAGQIDQAFNRAMAEFPQATIRDVRFPEADRIDVNFRAPRHNTLAVDIVSVKLSDGALLKRLPAESNPVLWMKVLPLHSGTALGLPGQIVLLMGGVALMILALTGPVMWWHARRPKRKRS